MTTETTTTGTNNTTAQTAGVDPNVARLLLTQLEALGMTPDDLVAFASGATGTGTMTLREFVTTRALKALTKGKRTVQMPYFALMLDGYPDLCGCMCADCMATFTGQSTWTPCPCVMRGTCSCRRADLERSVVAVGSCLEHCAGLGDRPLASVHLADWEHMARWAQLRARKRTEVRNAVRSAQGRATFAHNGRSAVEHFRGAASHVYTMAIEDGIPGVRTNIALKMTLKPRPKAAARSYSEAQLDELWQAIFTSGGNDPELDMLIIWTLLETGSRRGGPIGLKVGDLMFAANRMRLHEKNDKVDEQPVSPQLLATLLGHAIRRGGVVLHTVPGLAPEDVTVVDVIAGRAVLRTDAPVLYYAKRRKVTTTVTDADGTERKVDVLDEHGQPVDEPCPLTSKRFETIWKRLRADLVWLDQMHGRPHDLRKTMGTFVERVFGHAVAKRWLRHTEDDVTDTYTLASDQEVRAAHNWIMGKTG